MDIHLSDEECVALRKVLTSYLSDLRMEVVETDNPGYRRDLRHEEEVIRAVLGRID